MSDKYLLGLISLNSRVNSIAIFYSFLYCNYEGDLMTKNIGLFIKELRKQKRFTQKDLASKIGVSDKAISKWEVGDSFPDIFLLSNIAKVFEISTDELLNCQIKDNVKKSDNKTKKILLINIVSNTLLILLTLVFIIILLFTNDNTYGSLSITNYTEFSIISFSILFVNSLIISVYNLLQLNKKGETNEKNSNI